MVETAVDAEAMVEIVVAGEATAEGEGSQTAEVDVGGLLIVEAGADLSPVEDVVVDAVDSAVEEIVRLTLATSSAMRTETMKR